MLRPRLIPVLLLQGNGLVKTVRFKNPAYIGDPINAVKIFNERGADELLLIDLDASETRNLRDVETLKEIATEAFMPVGYGGGIGRLQDIERIVNCGFEKVIINSMAVTNPSFISEAAKEFGSSTLSVSADYKKDWLGKTRVISARGTVKSSFMPQEFAALMERSGAGEIILHNMDGDGTMKGYDLKLIESICKDVSLPVVACGGAKNYDDLAAAINAGALGAAAGSVFVYSGAHKAVLINYPDEAWSRAHLNVGAFR